MQQKKSTPPEKPKEGAHLSETISNAHSAGDGALRMDEDGLIEPSGKTLADADADKEAPQSPEEY